MVALAPFSAWPWESIGTFKYLLYGPFLWKVLHSRFEEDGSLHWCFHILTISALRCCMFQCWTSYSNMHFLARNRRILPQGVDFKQIDKERNWDNFIMLQALIGSMGLYTMLPKVGNLPVWEARGIMAVIILHIGVSEPLYYFGHRWFHRSYLFTHYHSLHHSSPVPQPFTAGYGTFLEQLLFAMVIGIPVVGCCLIGYGSLIMIYSYVLIFDLLRCLGYSNVEIVPYKIFDIFPFLRYVLYSPIYYSLHHTEIETNYCLFMPLFDALGNTLNTKSWELHKKIRLNLDKSESIPDFVFLIHIVDLTSFLHGPIFFRQFASEPFSTRLWLLPLWPVSFLIMLVMWAKGKTTLTSFYNLRGKLHHTWVVPRYCFQYLLPFAREGINKKIEEAILAADKLGVKIITLGGLNKNEALNGGGILFVEKHPNLKARVVHGNTLTAAIILKEINEDVKEVFLAGATSKLGRAIALYLSRRRVRVLMLTLSTERYEKIKNEATADCQKYLVQVTTCQAARSCKTWIVGKWVTPREQSWAPSGTHFHQFVVPPILAFRRDCTYGDLAAMRLPEDVQGLGCCEYTMERGIVHGCHAGGVVHTLEGWSHHEVGAIDVDRIDVVWEAALKHGLKPVSSG